MCSQNKQNIHNRQTGRGVFSVSAEKCWSTVAAFIFVSYSILCLLVIEYFGEAALRPEATAPFCPSSGVAG